jgi:hypothetical protein
LDGDVPGGEGAAGNYVHNLTDGQRELWVNGVTWLTPPKMIGGQRAPLRTESDNPYALLIRSL